MLYELDFLVYRLFKSPRGEVRESKALVTERARAGLIEPVHARVIGVLIIVN